jgi:lipoprotein-releasing system permease protein
VRQLLFISWRYLVARRKEAFISLISVISVAGIAIGVMALIVVIAVMSGFDNDLRDKIVGNYAHITVASPEGISTSRYEGLRKLIVANPRVKSVSPYVQGQLLLKEKETYFAVGFKGIDPATAAQVTELDRYLVKGSSGP